MILDTSGEPEAQDLAGQGDKGILVMVNGEYSNDSRVSRTVRFLGRSGYTVDVLSGVIDRSKPEVEDGPYGKVYRFKTLKPGRIGRLQGVVRMAAPSRNRRTVPSAVAAPGRALIKHLLYGLRLLFFVYLNARLLLQYRRLSADLYYANDFDTIMAAAWLARWHGQPFIYETHELAPDQLSSYPGWYRKAVMLIEGRLARRADKVVTVGEGIGEILQRRYRLKEGPIVVASCPYFTKVDFEPRREIPYRLLYHGVFNPDRGLEQLILAMHQIPTGHLFLRGYGYWEGPLRQLVEREGLSAKVTFLSPVSMDLLVTEASSFDVGVGAFLGRGLNSHHCRPNKVFEYMMAGLALAVSDLPELRVLVRTHSVGVVFNPADPDDIALKINELLADRDRLVQARRNALQAAREIYNFEIEGRKLFVAVSQVIGPPSAEPVPKSIEAIRI